MFGPLAVAYLFLGGAGAGAVIVATALDLAVAHTPFGQLSVPSFDCKTAMQRGIAFSLVAGFVMLLAAVVCLTFDLGRIDRIESLFLSPTFSVMSVGAFSLASALVAVAGLTVLHVAYMPQVPAVVARALQVVVLASGTVVMLYTGVLLYRLGSVPLWSTAWLVVLFAASSLSCGIAVVLLALVSQQQDDPLRIAHACLTLLRVDLAAVVFEALAALCMAACALRGADAAVLSAQQLLFGSYALWWWAFIVSGIVVPCALEVLILGNRDRMRVASALAIVAIAVLVGGAAMRLAVVGAGGHPQLALETPQITELSLNSGESLAASIQE